MAIVVSAVAIAVSAVAIVIPVMVVLYATAGAVPISGEIAAAFIARNDPSGAGIWHARPISGVPGVAMSDRVPVAFYPREIGAGTHRANPKYAWRRRSAYRNSDGDLREAGSAQEEHESR